MEKSTFELDKFTDIELIEIFASAQSNMDLDFESFKVLSEEVRKTDSQRFAKIKGIRYAILDKIANRFKETDIHDAIQAQVANAEEIMLVARGYME